MNAPRPPGRRVRRPAPTNGSPHSSAPRRIHAHVVGRGVEYLARRMAAGGRPSAPGDRYLPFPRCAGHRDRPWTAGRGPPSPSSPTKVTQHSPVRGRWCTKPFCEVTSARPGRPAAWPGSSPRRVVSQLSLGELVAQPGFRQRAREDARAHLLSPGRVRMARGCRCRRAGRAGSGDPAPDGAPPASRRPGQVRASSTRVVNGRRSWRANSCPGRCCRSTSGPSEIEPLIHP
jgi:hypothetical protein